MALGVNLMEVTSQKATEMYIEAVVGTSPLLHL